MNFKKLTIAAAVVAMTCLSAVAPVYAQAAAPAAPAADAAAPAAPAAAPAAADKPAAAAQDAPAQYSLGHIWLEGTWISRAILIVLAIMFVLGKRWLLTSRQSDTLGAIGYYWHFVDVVWIVVFSVIYLKVLS